MKRLLALLALALACGGGEEQAPAHLLPVPALELGAAESAVRAQVEAKRAALAAAVGDAAAATAWGELGQVHLTYDQLEAAAACFANARTLAPLDRRWVYLDAYVAGARGELERAATGLRRSLELDPTYLPAVLRLARLELERGDAAAAERLVRRALEREPAAAAAWQGLGEIAAARADQPGAVAAFERALAAEPGASALHYQLAQAHRAAGDEARAAHHLERRGDVAPRILDPLVNPLAGLAESVEFHLAQGGEALANGDFEAAAAAFAAARERSPESVAAARGEGQALVALGDLAGARKAFEAGLAGPPPASPATRSERADLLLRLAELLATSGEPGAALGRSLEAVELAPDDARTLAAAADALARGRRFAEAVELYTRLLGLQAENPRVLEKRATALVNLGRKEAAAADFQAALRLAPADARLRLRWAEALEFFGDRAAAAREREAVKAIATAPEVRAELLLASAEHLAASGDPAAVAKFSEALALVPDSLEGRYGLALALLRAGRFDDAAAAFRAVLASAPSHAQARRGLVAALVEAGRFELARVELQEALRLASRDAELALVQVRLLASAPDPQVRDGGLALEIALRVNRSCGDFACREALARAFAATGQHDEAKALLAELAEQAGRTGAPALAAALTSRLATLERGEPWVATSASEILAGPAVR